MLVPFVPSPPEVIREMLKCAKVKKDDILLDLGCGDGRIIKIAKEEFHVREAIGVEIDKRLCREAKNDDVEVVCGDMVTLSSILIPKVSVLTLYLSTRSNEILEDIILKYGKKGLRISSHDFTFEKLRPIKEIKVKAMGLLGWTEHVIYCYEL